VAACTDVTGFGLAGHAAEMAQGPETGLRLFYPELPLVPGAGEYAAMGLVPEGAYRNREGRLKFVSNAASIPALALDILFSPETSGGLLAALPKERAAAALSALSEAGVEAASIGETGGEPGRVEVVL
jgi:selenide,water dikinase